MEREELDQLTTEILERNIADSSLVSYNRCNSRFLEWLLESQPDAVVDGKINLAMVHEDPHIFLRFCTFCYKQHELRSSTLGTYRSAMQHLLASSGIVPSDTYTSTLKTYFEGLNRADAQRVREESQRACGGEAMPFSLFRQLANYCLSKGEDKYLFTYVFMVLMWNLMCNAVDVANLRLARIRWTEDSLAIYLAVPRPDQSTVRLKDPIHVYANPRQPEVCPVVALAVHLLYLGASFQDGLIFSGHEQDIRFRNRFNRVLDECKDMLQEHGLTPGEVSPSSIRHGSVTYALNGQTAGPGYFSVFGRAKWKQGLVQEKFVKYEKAGDQYVGRTAAGLPSGSSLFALLPPHFDKKTEADSTFVRDTIRSIFSVNLMNMTSLYPVLEHSLASLILHRPFFARTLPAASPFRQTFLFDLTDEHAERLRGLVIQATFRSEYMTATGIPPHVSQIAVIGKLREEMTSLVPNMVEEMTKLLEQRSADAGHMTPTAVISVVSDLLDTRLAALRDGVAGAAGEITRDDNGEGGGSLSGRHGGAAGSRDGGVNPIRDGGAGAGGQGGPASGRARCGGFESGGGDERGDTLGSVTWTVQAHYWGGGVFLVPKDWRLPRVNVANAWSLWVRGLGQEVPPLRGLSARQLGPNVTDREFSEWKVMFEVCETYLRALDAFCENPSREDVHLMFARLTPLLEARHRSNAGRKKRPASELMVSSMARKFRKFSEEDLRTAVAAEGDT